jgi:hypothetical protein
MWIAAYFPIDEPVKEKYQAILISPQTNSILAIKTEEKLYFLYYK